MANTRNELRVGSRVKLPRSTGYLFTVDYPVWGWGDKHILGTVRQVLRDDLGGTKFVIKWDNGGTMAFRRDDLALATQRDRDLANRDTYRQATIFTDQLTLPTVGYFSLDDPEPTKPKKKTIKKKGKKKMEFKIGDRVRCIRDFDGNLAIVGKFGSIVYAAGNRFFKIKFDEHINGHDCGGGYGVEHGFGWNFTAANPSEYFELEKPKAPKPKKIVELTPDNEGLSRTMGAMFAQVVMPKDHKKAILEALCQTDADKHTKLFTTWGFDKVLEKGKGIIFLFHGVPGTGKTMCAQAIAEHLGRKYMILGTGDLQSSVPGQMERNIKEAFIKATKEKLVVIFDECDSLLYKRNMVGAILGAEINTLLSEIERFDGVCILTTNRTATLDEALERRIALKLEFQKPDAQMREYIWSKLIPKKCPLAKDVDIKTLAKEFELCGGNIKNIVLSAARRAVHNEKDEVSMEDFLVAVEKELSGMSAFKDKWRPVSRVQQSDNTQDLSPASGQKVVSRVSDLVAEGGKNGKKR
jgi:AAA+ superfamily predicted ATPase